MIRLVLARHRVGGGGARLAVVAVCGAVWISVVAVVHAAQLTVKTLEAWERYVTVTEARMSTELAGQAPFLWVDRLPTEARDEAYARLRAGERSSSSVSKHGTAGTVPAAMPRSTFRKPSTR